VKLQNGAARAARYFPASAALVTLGAHLIGNPHYGFFRDELYFIVCGRHPAWGYVDQPPIAPLLAAASQLFGTSLFLDRAVPALFAAGAVYVTCLLVTELGGAWFGQLIAGLCVFFAPVLMNFGMKISPDTMGLVLWPLAALFVVRMAKGGDLKLWLAVGAAIGLALESKYSVLYFAIALLVGLVCTPARRILWSAWFVAGAGIATAIALPNFIWQAAHGFPMIELLRNGQNGKNLEVGPVVFAFQQLLITNLLLSPVWILGLVWLLARPAFRFAGIGYIALMLAMIVSHGKHYYAADVYPVLFAAGGVAIEQWTVGARIARVFVTSMLVLAGLVFTPFAMPILPEGRFITYANAVWSALHVNRSVVATEHLHAGALPQDWADMHGWPELAHTVARVYDGLPPAERAQAVAVGSNYGEAAAIEFFAPRVPVISGHNQYWLWGTRGYSGNVVIDVGGDCGAKLHLFRETKQAAIFSAAYVLPYENDLPIMVCRGIRIPISALWPKVKNYE
jgi:hypothetical protein